MSAATTTPHTPWPTVKLGDVCEVVLGGTPSTKIEGYWGGDVNWLTPSDMGKIEGMYVESTSRKITQEGLLKGSRLFPEKSVIVSTRAPIGYVLINTVPMCTNQGCKTLVPNKDVLAEFLCLNLRGRTDELNALGTGTTFRELATGNLKSISIPLPPLEVQREIVAKVEAGLKEADGLVAHFKRLAALADDTFKAELDETFSTLNVPTVKLGDVCVTTSGGTPLRTRCEYYENGNIPWLRSGEVCQKDITQTEMFITQQGVENSSAKLIPVNSVVVAMYGATAGQVGILRIESTTNQAVCGVLPSNKYVPEFLYYQLLSMKKVMVSQAQGGAQPNISQIKIKNLQIYFPSLDIQREIVAKLEAVKARCERLKAEAERGLKAAEALRKAVLAEAFEQ